MTQQRNAETTRRGLLAGVSLAGLAGTLAACGGSSAGPAGGIGPRRHRGPGRWDGPGGRRRRHTDPYERDSPGRG